MSTATAPLCAAADHLADSCNNLRFAKPVTHVYHPLIYARAAHHAYLRLSTSGNRAKQALFLGMNPGPWGMAQTGVPFGEVAAVRDWMGIQSSITEPANMHAKRPVLGLQCPRSEVSGRRLWGLCQNRYPRAQDFFAAHAVLNYCPLLFLAASARRVTNLTPDKLPRAEQMPLFAACDEFLQTAVRHLRPQILIGVGGFAKQRLHALFPEREVGSILHPSPASPAANRGFAHTATAQLKALGLDF